MSLTLTKNKLTKIMLLLIKIFILILLVQCFPGNAWGYDINGFIKGFTDKQIEQSNKIIAAYKSKITTPFNQAADWFKAEGLKNNSSWIKKYGLDQQNTLVKGLDYANNFGYGLAAGLLKGSGTLCGELYSLGAKIPTAPERLISFGYRVSENPKKYQDMVINGVQTVAGVALNPLPIIDGLYGHTKEVVKDPLKAGSICGETATVIGSCFIGGGQIKALAKAGKISKTYPKVPLDELAPLIKNNKRLPMNEGVVRTVADMSGADLSGVKIKIVNKIKIDEKGEEILATTSTFRKKITFYKGAFNNPLTLAYVIGHERTHLFQFGLYRGQLLKTGVNAFFSKTGLKNFDILINNFERAAYATHRQWQLYFIDSWKTYNRIKLL